MTGIIAFEGGDHGPWRVTRAEAPTGAGLPKATRVSVSLVDAAVPAQGTQSAVAWRLRGAISNLRYTTRSEADSLRSVQPSLDRPTAIHAALIPIKKSQRWWELAQDERREIFEETSHHTALGLRYLPAIARRLHHSRDLGEPFDFLTWFEFATEHEADFETLLGGLRATREWTFIEREVDLRLTRDAPGSTGPLGCAAHGSNLSTSGRIEAR